MTSIFSKDSSHKKRARWLAITWTLLIFVLCFLPGQELPEVDIPFIDKWAHVALFALFSFLWLCANPSKDIRFLLALLLITIFLGWLVEYIQGNFVPGRYEDHMDTLADSVGGAVGIAIFVLLFYLHERRQK